MANQGDALSSADTEALTVLSPTGAGDFRIIDLLEWSLREQFLQADELN